MPPLPRATIIASPEIKTGLIPRRRKVVVDFRYGQQRPHKRILYRQTITIMKTIQLLIIGLLAAVTLSSCVVRDTRRGITVSSLGYYDTLPRTYRSPYYYYGNRYYYGGRWEPGRYYYEGRYHSGRYNQGGSYYYGGRYSQGRRHR